MGYRIGVDIGGTFTDFTVVADAGGVFLWKEDTTADDPARAIMTGLVAIAERLELGVAELLGATDLFVHGTTVATNMLIQRNGPRVGLLATEGFRDVLYFRDGYKPDRFNVHMDRPAALVDRWLRLGVPERTAPDGSELRPLDETAVREAATRFRQAGVESVAIAFLWSIVDPAHELRAAEIVREELAGAHVVCSHAILPEIREWERTSATVLSAYILPRIRAYLTTLERRLTDVGLARPLLVMQANGGCARVGEIVRRPVNILASGPAAAPAAALHLARDVGRDLISLDMGGTSLDVCLIRDGRATMSRDIRVADQPIGVPAVDVQSVGAGGGSIAWLDAGGALRVGPQSAGARPGPACYGFGGTRPTVTDADVVLGYLDPDAFLGGRRRLRRDLAADAIAAAIAQPLGLSTLEAAAGIVRVVNANMVAAIRAVSVERGIDPRGFALVCAGGAGGLHAVELARELGIRTVFVPVEAGVFCSFGMTVTEIRHDHVAAEHATTTGADLDRINATLAELEETARRQLLEEGLPEQRIRIERAVDARYPGQYRELTTPIASPGPLTPAHLAEIETAFHRQHRLQYAYERPELAVELLHWRVTGVGAHAHGAPPPATEPGGREAVPAAVRPAYFPSAAGVVETSFFEAGSLTVGARIEGPAVISAPTTTIVLHPGDLLTMRSDDGYNIDVRLPAREQRAPARGEAASVR